MPELTLLRERREGERRVLLLPSAIPLFRQHGCTVFVEEGAGAAAGHSDAAYEAAGARIVSASEAWRATNLVFKYKAPLRDEWRHFRNGLTIVSYMHAEGDLALAEAMRATGVVSYAIEFFQTPAGDFPLQMPDSEISGKLAVILAAYHLQSSRGGRGILMARTVGATPAKVVVIGYGSAGGAAAQLAAAMGAKVTVFGTRPAGLRRFQALMPDNVDCQVNDREKFERAVLTADVVIGAILISTHDTPPMLDEGLVKRMKKGAVIVDVTCGYGSGYLPTFDRFSTHQEPCFERHGVLHVKIDAMPASVPLTAAEAMTNNATPYLVDLARDVLAGVEDRVSRSGIITKAGEILHPELIRHVELLKASGVSA